MNETTAKLAAHTEQAIKTLLAAQDEPWHTCPACGSPEYVTLGQLGQRVHLRCRDCGIGYSHAA
jgi:transcription elongation factor Elf1